MATVDINIGGRSHQVGCRDGEEAAIQALARRLDDHAQAAAQAAGSPSGERMMLFVALMLADELNDAQSNKDKATAAPVPPTIDPTLLDRIATRLEAVAATLEQSTSGA